MLEREFRLDVQEAALFTFFEICVGAGMNAISGAHFGIKVLSFDVEQEKVLW